MISRTALSYLDIPEAVSNRNHHSRLKSVAILVVSRCWQQKQQRSSSGAIRAMGFLTEASAMPTNLEMIQCG
jgi:hypothetical protein